MMTENEPDPLRRIPTKRPAEIHAEIGAVLRAARLKRGQTIDTVVQLTRISKKFLEALENDRFDEFPAFVYMRGFLKGYCDHLDVNFDELWAKIEPQTLADAPASAPSTPPAAGAKSSQPAAPKHTPHAHPAAGSHTVTDDASSATGAIIFALILALGLGIWIFNTRKSAGNDKAVETTPRALRPLPRTIEPKVTLLANSDTWVRASVDGFLVFEGRMPRGALMEWKPARTVTLRTTAPSALQLTVNGTQQNLENPSAEGEYRIDVP
jgi:transcriptional regulator with XRE-family HTH domain